MGFERKKLNPWFIRPFEILEKWMSWVLRGLRLEST